MTIAGRPMGQEGPRGRAGRPRRSRPTHAAGAVSLAAADGTAAMFARDLSGSVTAARGTLIAYTDGLVERRGETLDTGLHRLLQAATARCGSSLDDLLTGLVSELTGDSPTDDIALIGLRWLN